MCFAFRSVECIQDCLLESLGEPCLCTYEQIALGLGTPGSVLTGIDGVTQGAARLEDRLELFEEMAHIDHDFHPIQGASGQRLSISSVTF